MRQPTTFGPPKNFKTTKAQEGHCTKCGQQFTHYSQPAGSYAYKTANGTWVTGQTCKNCANKPKTGAIGTTTRYNYHNEKRLRAIIQMEDKKTEHPPRKRQKRAKRKNRGPYGTGNSQAVKELLEELKKPSAAALSHQRFWKEKTWKQHWATDTKLRLLFTGSYKGMRSFASSYGYGVGNVSEMKKHKESIGEGRRR